MTSAIPILNIYYLLLYAWDRLPEGGILDISGVDSTELADLFAAVLLGGVRHLMRRGLDQSYVAVTDEIPGIRGRVDFAGTARRLLAQHGRALCEFDEFTVDTLPNRILLASIRRVSQAEGLASNLRHDLGGLARSLNGISRVRLDRRAFRQIQLHGNNSFYAFLLSVCKLILESSILVEASGEIRFRDFLRDPDRMAMLFERFLFNFIRREIPNADVRRERIYWSARSESDPSLSLLPSMQTDISVRLQGRTIIIDAKYYEKTLQEHFGAQTFRSAHLYQVFSYLKNIEVRGGQDAAAEGLLLYPKTDAAVRQSYEIGGHKISVASVDLAQPWRYVRSELLEIVQ